MSLFEALACEGRVPRKRDSAQWRTEVRVERRLSTQIDVHDFEKEAEIEVLEVGDAEDPERQYQVELMIRHLYKRAIANGWFGDEQDEEQHIRIALRATQATEKLHATYVTAPHIEAQFDADSYLDLLDLAGYLQCEVVVAITSKVSATLLRHLPPYVKTMPLDESNKIQVINTFADFMSIRRAQGAAFVREYSMLLIWSENVHDILAFGSNLEEKMVNLIWDEKQSGEKSFFANLREVDLEEAAYEEGDRSVSFVHPCMVALAMMAMATFIGQDLREVMLEIKAEGNYQSIAIVAYFPVLIWLAAFFAQTFSVTIFQALGPVSQLTTNSKYYSSIPPKRKIELDLPHITIQCPIYKEDLELVLEPAMQTVKDAVATYEMQGGTASIFVSDDGMRLITPAEQLKRQAFYSRNGVGWVARPAHGEADFVRAGKFKKASNLNYSMNISYLLETGLAEIDRPEDWKDMQERLAIDQLTQQILKEQEPPASGGGDLRIGDLILLIDADTRIPSDCLLDAANEFNNCSELAILQHTSLAFQVVHNYWEDCMAYFTMFVSQAMRFMTAGGDVCPFIGHNAFLRWSAVQELGFVEKGQHKWWSEAHVSEDFEMSLKLQELGYCVRMAAYSGGEFKEGVSLTVYDEFNRWQKYAYGISELCFHPMRYWPTRSPFTPLFRQYICSARITFASKFTMLAYMGSYYAIASLWLLAIVNYFILGWMEVTITSLYQSSFQILIATLVLFDVAVPILNAVYRYRSRQAPLFHAVYQNMKWILLLCIFFGGLSMHVTQSLLWHLLGIPLQWGSTAKSLESSYFLKELPMIWSRYRALYLFIMFISIGTVVLATPAVPTAWRIAPRVYTAWPVAWTLACHAIAPLILNPQSWLSELHL